MGLMKSHKQEAHKADTAGTHFANVCITRLLFLQKENLFLTSLIHARGLLRGTFQG